MPLFCTVCVTDRQNYDSQDRASVAASCGKNGSPCYRTVVLSVMLGVLWPNGWMDQDEAWHAGRPWQHCVRWGPSSPHGEAQQPSFSKFTGAGFEPLFS